MQQTAFWGAALRHMAFRARDQIRDQIRATVATYTTAAATLDPLTHCARPTQPVSWCCREALDPTVPQRELQKCVLNVDMQNPLCAFHTFTVVSEEADITRRDKELTHP